MIVAIRDGLVEDADAIAAVHLVCELHHHDVHEGGWTFTMAPDRIATSTRPDGTIYWTGPLNDRKPNAA